MVKKSHMTWNIKSKVTYFIKEMLKFLYNTDPSCKFFTYNLRASNETLSFDVLPTLSYLYSGMAWAKTFYSIGHDVVMISIQREDSRINIGHVTGLLACPLFTICLLVFLLFTTSKRE